MQVEVAYLISIVSLAFSVFFGLKSSKHTDTKDIEERVKDNTRINMKLDAIAGTMQEIKTELSSMREDINSHNDKIIKLESSLKSAHHRLDTLEDRFNQEQQVIHNVGH